MIELPPKWPGVAMISAGVFGLLFITHPRAASVALVIVLATFLILSALCELVLSGRHEQEDAAEPYEHQQRMDEYSRELAESHLSSQGQDRASQ